MATTSKRAHHLVHEVEFKLNQYFTLVRSNLYNAESNPGGIIDLGVSTNDIVWDMIAKKLGEVNYEKMPKHYIHYNEVAGPIRFRTQLAAFFNRYMKPVESIVADDVHLVPGAGSCCEILGEALLDEGDGILIPEPYYSAFDHEYQTIAKGRIFTFPVVFGEQDQGMCDPATEKIKVEIRYKELEAAVERAAKENVKIKALLIINPSNPIGNIYEDRCIETCLKFCNENKLHFISDEVYMKSVHSGEKFRSVLNLGPQPDNVHVIWSFSKDFGMCGFRAGVIITKCKDVSDYVTECVNRRVPTMLAYALEPIITDFEWLDTEYFPTNLKRLSERYEYIKGELEAMSVTVFPAGGGLFLWADFRAHVHPLTEEGEMKLFEKLLECGVYIVPSNIYHASRVGFFRVVFSVEMGLLQKAAARIRLMLTAENGHA